MQFPILVYNKEQFSCLLHYKLLHLSVTHLAVQHKERAWIKNAFVYGADRDVSMFETFPPGETLSLAATGLHYHS